MESELRQKITEFVLEDAGNRFHDSNDCFYGEPLIGFASAVDSIFTEYKSVIGDFHLTPAELVSRSAPDDTWRPATVISWVLPITESTKASNRLESVYPSKPWSSTRNSGEEFNNALRRHVVEWLNSRGYRAAAPSLMPVWQAYRDTPAGVASSWSERHAAYACGLGTFSLNDALITPKGIAHRLGSVITDLKITPSGRFYEGLRSNCLHYHEKNCGACIRRCPVGAISEQGHDKNRCYVYVYETIPAAVGEMYGDKVSGCGLCQTKVPCESRIPVK